MNSEATLLLTISVHNFIVVTFFKLENYLACCFVTYSQIYLQAFIENNRLCYNYPFILFYYRDMGIDDKFTFFKLSKQKSPLYIRESRGNYKTYCFRSMDIAFTWIL